MTTLVSLSRDSLSVEPGASVELDLVVRNDGTVVDSFTVSPLGIPAQWVRAEPPELSLFPGAEGSVHVVVAPPRVPEVAPGPRPFGLRVLSAQDEEGSVVEEGVLDIGCYTSPYAELHPHTSHARGRGSGRHRVAVDNRGNVPLELHLTAGDRDGLLDVGVSPTVLVVQPGEAGLATLRPRARKGFWRGPDRTTAFTLALTPPDGAPIELEAAFLQQARLPRWLPKALAALVALAVLAALLWQGMVKPAVKAQARQAGAQAAKAEVAPLKAAAAAPGAKAPGSAAPGSAPAATGAPTVPVAAGADPLGDPTTARVQLGTGKQSGTAAFGATTFSLTDLILSNPTGSAGVLTLRRGADVLLQSDLASFRDLDYHFVAPLVFAPGQQLKVQVDGCTAPGPAACSAAVFVSGFAKPVAKG